MYDKVRLWAMRTRATPDVSKFLDKAKDQIDHETGEVCTFGSLEGLKVSIYTGGISVIGSLAKFLYQTMFTRWIDTAQPKRWKSYQIVYICR